MLTEAGRCLIDYARQILASIGDARRCVDELKGEVAGKVAVGAIPTIAPYVLPELVVTFQKHYPDVTLEIVEDVTEGVTRRIEAGELDVALASTCRPSPTLRRESLGTEPLLALVPKEHPLAKKDFVEFDDLKSLRFLLLHEMHCLSQQVNHLLESRRLRPEIALAGSQLSTIANMVAASIGVSIVPQMMVKHHATPGMRQSAVRSAGSGAGTQSSLQSASISEQRRRSIPSGSGGCPCQPNICRSLPCDTSEVLISFSPAPPLPSITLARPPGSGLIQTLRARANNEGAPCARIVSQGIAQCVVLSASYFPYDFVSSNRCFCWLVKK